MSGVKKLVRFIPTIACPTLANKLSVVVFSLKEGSHAEVGQVIAGIKFRCFLTPDVAWKIDADKASSYPSTDLLMPCLASFLTPCLAPKSLENIYL